MPGAVTDVTTDRKGRVHSANLKRLREKADLTRQELADGVGSTYDHIWRLEAGKRDVLSETLRKIADVLADNLDQPVGDVLAELTNPQ